MDTGRAPSVKWGVQRDRLLHHFPQIPLLIFPRVAEILVAVFKNLREADNIQKYYRDYNRDYTCTENLAEIGGSEWDVEVQRKPKNLELFSATGSCIPFITFSNIWLQKSNALNTI